MSMQNGQYDSESSEERQSDLAVMDAEEYNQKRRLKRVLDAHDRVEEADRVSSEMITNGQWKGVARNYTVLRALQEFIRECYNLLRQHARDTPGRDEYWKGDPNNPLGKIEMEHDSNIVFVGLQDILRAKKVYVETWEGTKDHRHMANETVELQRKHQIPIGAIWNGFLRLKKFLEDEHDLDLTFESREVDDDADPF